MADSRAKELVAQSERLFSRRTGLDALWQTIAENFYVERADFTTNRTEGAEFADHLFGSYPVLARRELGNLFASVLRPRSLEWFSLHISDEEIDQKQDVRAYLEHISKIQWRAMYDPEAQFVDATRAADHDFAAFGNAVIEATLNNDRSALLHRCHHLRDCAWSENASGVVDTMYRRWSPTARQLAAVYPTKISKDTQDKLKLDPDAKVECCHIVVPRRVYQPDSKRDLPFTVLYIEKDSQTVLEESPEKWFRFVVPRWHKVSGSPYARSPATEIVLPDARTFQVVIRTLREAGEMHVNPPMIGVADALRSDVQLYPGGFTAVDIEFDNDLKNALAPIDQNPGSMPIGFEIAAALRDDIRLGFFLDKIKLPEVNSRAMTAYEVQKRLEEYVRAASPLFEPIEDEYNAKICNLDFEILKSVGAFGNPRDIPQELNGAQVEFKFRSPLRDVQDQAKAGLFGDIMARILGPAAQIDPAQMANLDMTFAVRDAMRGLGAPAKWLGKEEAVAQAKKQLEEQNKMQMGLAAAQQGGMAAEAIGKGAQAMTPMMQPQPA